MAALRGRPKAAQTAVPGKFVSFVALDQWLHKASQTSSWHDWRWQVRNSLDAADLARLGLLPDNGAALAAVAFPVRVTPYFMGLGNYRHPADPLRLQWLPQAAECEASSGDSTDPFGEAEIEPLPGVVHRFKDRLLVLTSTCCALRCRHCTRKNGLETRHVLRRGAALAAVVAYIKEHPAVREVIISGGDPLLADDTALTTYVRAFAKLPQIDAVRIGTRTPVTLPMRITTALATKLAATGKVWINTQFNHADELSTEAVAACARLVEVGIPVSNQTVLLKGVNDSLAALYQLCCGLQRARVRPYYVFVGDPVSGTAHFRVSVARAAALADQLSAGLGGLAMPRFVADIPGAAAKIDVHALLSRKNAPPERFCFKKREFTE